MRVEEISRIGVPAVNFTELIKSFLKKHSDRKIKHRFLNVWSNYVILNWMLEMKEILRPLQNECALDKTVLNCWYRSCI